MVLSAINLYPTLGYAGMVVGINDGRDVETYINNAATAAGVYDLVFAAVNLATYTADIYGVHVAFTADGTATVAEIRDGMLAQIALQPALALRVTAAASSNNVRITELNPELYGAASISGLDANSALSTVTAHQQLEIVPAGVLVSRGSGFQDMLLLHSASDPLVGITIHQHMPVSSLVASTRAGFPPKSEISVLKRGKIWMVAEEAVTLTDTPFFRYASLGANVGRGTVRNDADSSTCRSGTTFAKFMTAQSSPGGLVLVQINLVP